jgi:WS/DGAT/MGAT family acyltransferase
MPNGPAPEPDQEPLSSVDYAWLRMDEPANLMVINGVLVLEEGLEPEALRRVLEERLLAIPRFRWRVVRRSRGRPVWQEDPDFDLDRHMVVERVSPPGDQAALRDAISDRLGAPLDPDHPPWCFHLLQGLDDGASVLMGRLHHCLGDGIALMLVLLSLTELEEGGQPGGTGPTETGENPFRMLFGGGKPDMDRVRRLAEHFMPEGMRLMLHPADALQRANRWLKGVAMTGSLGRLALRKPDPKTVLKGKLKPGKRAAWSGAVPLEQVKEIQGALGGTVNDVLLTAVAGGLRRYLEGRGQEVRRRLAFRAAVPVNLRPLHLMDRLGNHFGLVFLSLPVGIVEPTARLAEVRRRMRALRSSAEPLVTFRILKILGLSPHILQRAVVQLLAAKTTVVMTNVPGPRETLYLGGKPIREIFFWVPQAGRVGMGLSICSYAGQVRLGVGTDAGLVPDPEGVVEGFEEEIEALRRLARAAG